MDCRSQLELLRNQLTDVMAKLGTCSGRELEAAETERISLDRTINEVSAELFILLDNRQKSAGQIADIARSRQQQQSSSSGQRLTGHTGPVSYGPPSIEEINDLGDTY